LRYSERFFCALEQRAAKAKTPKNCLMAFCDTYCQALKDSDKICLCGLLGAETCGLPDQLKLAVAEFFTANILWVAKSLPQDQSEQQRQAKAAQVVATLQGAMMLATSLQDHKVFDAAARELIAGLDP